jgi:hypothetical protein
VVSLASRERIPRPASPGCRADQHQPVRRRTTPLATHRWRTAPDSTTSPPVASRWRRPRSTLVPDRQPPRRAHRREFPERTCDRAALVQFIENPRQGSVFHLTYRIDQCARLTFPDLRGGFRYQVVKASRRFFVPEVEPRDQRWLPCQRMRNTRRTRAYSGGGWISGDLRPHLAASPHASTPRRTPPSPCNAPPKPPKHTPAWATPATSDAPWTAAPDSSVSLAIVSLAHRRHRRRRRLGTQSIQRRPQIRQQPLHGHRRAVPPSPCLIVGAP